LLLLPPNDFILVGGGSYSACGIHGRGDCNCSGGVLVKYFLPLMSKWENIAIKVDHAKSEGELMVFPSIPNWDTVGHLMVYKWLCKCWHWYQTRVNMMIGCLDGTPW